MSTSSETDTYWKDGNGTVDEEEANENVDHRNENAPSKQDTLPYNQGAEPPKELGFWGIWAFLTTFDTTGAVIAMPYAIGQLGFILGPLLMLSWAALALAINLFVIQVAEEAKTPVYTLGDVGYQMGGTRGRHIIRFMQLLNLVLYLPVALETVGLSAQYLSNDALGGCTGYWNIIGSAGLFLLLQLIREWNDATWLAYAGVAMVVSKAFVFLPYSFVEYEQEVKDSSYYMGPVQAFGAPDSNWYDIGLAFATFPFGFPLIFVIVEIWARKKESMSHASFKKAVYLSTACQMSLYLVSGLVGAALWGWSVANPVTLEIPNDTWVGILLSVFVLLAVILDYIIASLIVNDEFAVTFLSGMTSSTNSWRKRLAMTLPSSALVLGLVSAIPNFTTLIGVVTGVTIVGCNTWCITWAWHLGKRCCPSNSESKGIRVLHFVSVFVGVPLTLWVVASSLYAIAMADFSSNFFCQS